MLVDVLDLRTARRSPGGGGIIPSAHSNLTGLGYEESGHTGFASAVDLASVVQQSNEIAKKTYGIVNIVEFGGKDDGVTDNRQSLLDAKAFAGLGGTVIFPRTVGIAESIYYFSAIAVSDTENIVLDVAENVIISLPNGLQYGQKLTLTRDTVIKSRSINATRTYPRSNIKKHYISESDLDKSVVIPVLASTLVGKSSTWATTYNITDFTPTQVDTKEVSVANSGAIRISSAGLGLAIGETFTASFSNTGTESFHGGVLVLTQDSYAFLYLSDAGGIQSVTIGVKRGASAFTQGVHMTFGNYLSYKSQNTLWSVERVSATAFRVFANGVNVTKGIIDLGGDITFCGLGAYGRDFNIKNMVREVNKVRSGVEPLKFTLFGDSLTADVYGNWAHTFKDALDGSFGLRVAGITNKADGGATSTTQLSKMQNEGISSANYVIILLGTNDIQTQGAVSTYIANIQSMVTIARTAGARVILGVPPLYYSNTFTGTGQNTGNYEKGAEYRSALLRFAAENSIKIVDLLNILGVVRAEFDILYDNIHPSFYTSELMGLAFAKAVLGDYLTNKNSI